jgi:hypothetical protein
VSDDDLQALLDGVASDLGAPLTLSDVKERLIAYTAHADVMDDVRRSGLLHRHLPVEVRAWFEQWGIREAVGPVRTPADKTLGAVERWCVPVRYRGVHLGYVWVLDAGGIDRSELGPAIEATEQIGALLFRRRLLRQADSDLLRLILIPTPDNEGVAAEVRAFATGVHDGPIAVVVVGAPHGDDLSPTALSDLELAVQRAAENASSETALAGVISGLGVLLAPLQSGNDLSAARRLAERVCSLAAHLSDDLEIVAAIGGATKLERASHSYAEARRALRIARAVPDLGPIAAWDDLGVFRALAFMPVDEIADGVLDSRVRQLLADKELAATAEIFLDLAGNIQETAARLYLHRATLYQRLDRIAERHKLDLRRNGDHRLLAHLGLKLAQLGGL